MDLYLLRHGEAGKRVPVASRDSERGLTAAGEGEVEEVGRAMDKLGLKFDVVASSPLKRAKDTADLVNKALKMKGGVEEWPELSPEGDRALLSRRLGRLRRDSKVLCVGHEPYLTDLASEIVGGRGAGVSSVRMALKKSGLIRLEVTGFNPTASGELRWLLTPKLIRKMV